MKFCNAIIHDIFSPWQWNLHNAKTVTLSWHVQSFIKIGSAYFKQITPNFDRIVNSIEIPFFGTGAWLAKKNLLGLTAYCQADPKEYVSVTFSKIKSFHSRKWNSKCRLWNGIHLSRPRYVKSHRSLVDHISGSDKSHIRYISRNLWWPRHSHVAGVQVTTCSKFAATKNADYSKIVRTWYQIWCKYISIVTPTYNVGIVLTVLKKSEFDKCKPFPWLIHWSLWQPLTAEVRGANLFLPLISGYPQMFGSLMVTARGWAREYQGPILLTWFNFNPSMDN